MLLGKMNAETEGLKKTNDGFMYVCTCVHICALCVQKLSDQKESIGTGVAGNRELMSELWQLNPGPLKSSKCF